MSDELQPTTLPRYMLDQGFLTTLATVDSSFGEQMVDGRLLLLVDYRRGCPQSAQLIRINGGAVSFKLHMRVETP